MSGAGPQPWVEVARRQCGVVTRTQLRAAGLTEGRIRGLLAGGGLTIRARGTYLVRGAPVTPDVVLWTAVLTTGGVLGYLSAAQLWDVPVEPPQRVTVIVSPQARVRATTGVRLRRVLLPSRAMTRRYGLPLTARTWTLLDAVGDLPVARAVELADRALQQRWLTRQDIVDRLEEFPGRWGSRTLRRVLAVTGDGAAAKSERVLHRLLRQAGLTGWQANHVVRVAGRLVAVADVAFPAAWLIIEVDGLAHHSTPERFQRDRARQNDLVAAGWTVLRFTWHDLVDRPDCVIAAISAQLARSR